jgi:predicted nucleic acid-binding protein
MAAPVYADTSFLVSLYVQDAHSPRAAVAAPRLLPLLFTPLIEHELRNAIRRCVYRRQITAAQRQQALDDLEHDREAGVLHGVPLDWTQVFEHAEALGRLHTERHGDRGMDILHVASALALRAKRFATFDDHQRELAKLAGLQVVV